MNHRIHCKSIYITDTTGEYILSYYISCNSTGGYNTYGVGIEKQNENSVITEAEFISDIFTSEKKAKYVLDNLCRRSVMPTDLNSALEELFNRDMQRLHPENKGA